MFNHFISIRAVVGFWKVVRPLNAADVHRVPKAQVRESTRVGKSSSRLDCFTVPSYVIPVYEVGEAVYLSLGGFGD